MSEAIHYRARRGEGFDDATRSSPEPEKTATETMPVEPIQADETPQVPSLKKYAGRFDDPDELEKDYREKTRRLQQIEEENKILRESYESFVQSQPVATAQSQQPPTGQGNAPANVPPQLREFLKPTSDEWAKMQEDYAEGHAMMMSRILPVVGQQFVQMAMNQTEQRMVQRQNIQQLESEFYAEHKDLDYDGGRTLVNSIAMDVIKRMPPQDQMIAAKDPKFAMRKISEAARAILRQPSQPTGQKPVAMETPSARKPVVPDNRTPDQKAMDEMVNWRQRNYA